MSLVDPNAADDEVWDATTGETFGEARVRFATFGDEVDWQSVPDLVRAGFTVWSFGYGDDPQNFTSIEGDDLEWWDDGDERPIMEWAPFRVDPTDAPELAYVRFAIKYLDDWSMAPMLDEVTQAILYNAVKTIRRKYGED